MRRGQLLPCGSMTTLLIVIIVLAVVVIAGLAVTNPLMRRREDAAIAAVKGRLGADAVVLIEPRTTAMGTEPEAAGGLRGMVCLGLGELELIAVTWVGGKEWVIDRSAITAVDTPAED